MRMCYFFEKKENYALKRNLPQTSPFMNFAASLFSKRDISPSRNGLGEVSGRFHSSAASVLFFAWSVCISRTKYKIAPLFEGHQSRNSSADHLAIKSSLFFS